MKRWVHGDSRYPSVIQAEYEGDDARTLSFRDLVQCLAVRTARSRGLSLARIRDAIHHASTRYPFPLARRHELYSLGDQLLLRIDNEDMVGVTKGIERDQFHLVQIVEPFLEQLTFGDDGYANRWIVDSMTLGSGERLQLVLDPLRRFGQPVIEPYGVLASALVQSLEAEGTLEAASAVHGLPQEAFKLAVRYFDSLTGLA